MKKIVVVFFLFLSQHLCAQDKEMIAEALFTKATDLFTNGNYKEALANLRNVENALEQTNSKILFLQTEIYDSLAKTSWKYADSTERTYRRFFDLVDASNYPKDKYMVMTNISIDISDKKQKYESDFELLKKSADVDDVGSYIATYPGSAHATELKSHYDELIEAKLLQKQAGEHSVNGDYEGALALVISAEKIIGQNDPDLLYRKINICKHLFNNNWKYVDSADNTLTHFFSIVDQAKYSAEDYMDMKKVSIDVKEKKRKYDDEYNALVSNSNYGAYPGFIETYAGSSHAIALQSDLDKHNAEVKQEEIRAQRAREEQERRDRIAREEQRKRDEIARKEQAERDRIDNQMKLKKLFRGMTMGVFFSEGVNEVNYSNLYNYPLSSVSGAVNGLSLGVDLTLGYMFNKFFGIFSGVSANYYSWTYSNNISYQTYSANVVYATIPLVCYFNTCNGNHRVGLYAEGGLLFNNYVSGSDFIDSNNYFKSLVVSTFVSGGLSIRSKCRKGTFQYGFYYKSSGNIFTDNPNESGKIGSYGLKLGWQTYLKSRFGRKYTTYKAGSQ